jgi:hypothetical protein
LYWRPTWSSAQLNQLVLYDVWTLFLDT